MIAAMMLMRFIWNPATPVNCAARRGDCGACSRTLRRVAGAPLAALPSLVEAGLGHLVDPVVLARNERRANRADRARNAHRAPSLGDPPRAVGPVLDVGHAVAQLARGARGEQLGRQPR